VSALRGILADLREKRLWALVAALAVALIAVPLALSSGPGTTAQPAPLSVGADGSGTGAGGIAGASGTSSGAPAQLTVNGSPSASLGGAERDPFTQQVSASGAHSAAAVAAPSAVVGAGTAPAGAASSGGSTAASGSASGASQAGASATVSPSTSAGRASTGASSRRTTGASLRATQTYRVSLAIARPTGAFATANSLLRLSILPSGRMPLIVELGVLHGGRRVLFAVMPGTLVHGPGLCTPSGTDCEIVSLAPGQVEDLGERVGGVAFLVARFAVTAITAETHASAAAAARARRAVSAAGRRLLDRVKLPALSLFAYQPSSGTLRDLRNLVIARG
jgi:hypothetical protein